MAGEFFAADEEGIEGVGAVGAVFEKVLLRFGEFLASLVFTEAIAPSGDSSGLNGEEEVVVVLAVEEGHEPLLSCEGLVDEEVLLVVAHGVAEIDIVDLPSVALELVADDPMEVLVVDGVVRAEGGGVVVIDDGFVAVELVVTAEVVDEGWDFAVELGVEGLEDEEGSVVLFRS